MAKWTTEEHLAFDIAFALKKVTIPGAWFCELYARNRLAISGSPCVTRALNRLT